MQVVGDVNIPEIFAALECIFAEVASDRVVESIGEIRAIVEQGLVLVVEHTELIRAEILVLRIDRQSDVESAHISSGSAFEFTKIFRELQGFKFGAVPECDIAYGRQRIGKIDCFEISASVKGRRRYCSNALFKSYLCNRAALCQNTLSY